MNDQMNETMMKFYDSLSDEQKVKVKECKTPEEFMKLIGEDGMELPDEMLEMVSGGSFWKQVVDWVSDKIARIV